jgi:hypothetical protein
VKKRKKTCDTGLSYSFYCTYIHTYIHIYYYNRIIFVFKLSLLVICACVWNNVLTRVFRKSTLIAMLI